MAMRDWNSQHQGVYVPLSPDARSDDLLADPLREITSTQGIRLAKINHAQMTRMIADVLKEREGIHIHITSLTPLRPRNSPDVWEREALTSFSAGIPEAYGVQTGGAGKAEFRYMAPLKADLSCMNCHHEHKDVQEVRGGLSVSFDYSPFPAAHGSCQSPDLADALAGIQRFFGSRRSPWKEAGAELRGIADIIDARPPAGGNGPGLLKLQEHTHRRIRPRHADIMGGHGTLPGAADQCRVHAWSLPGLPGKALPRIAVRQKEVRAALFRNLRQNQVSRECPTEVLKACGSARPWQGATPDRGMPWTGGDS